MSLSSLRRVAPSSYRSLCRARFAATVSNPCAFDTRSDGHDKAAQPISSQGRGTDHLGHPLESSKTESYLLSLLTDGVTPSLRDLERLKPLEHPDLHSKEYTAVYGALLDSICRSFSNDQLRSFTQQYGLSLGSKLRKVSYAKAIVENAWQWPSLKHASASGRAEVTSLVLALSPSELFILLGKNGSDLFQLSREYNVYASVKRNPLSLYLEGSRDSVKGAEEYIDRVRKGILEDTFDTPSKHPIPQDAFHSISRLSGAFVEKTEDQKLRVRAKHPSNIMLAKRLAIRVNYQTELSELLAQQIHYEELRTPTAAPLAYSLYPFSGPRSLPTMMRSSTFLRWRRVGDWLGDTHSQSLDSSGLAHSQGSLFSMDDGAVINLQNRLLGDITSGKSRRLVSAFSGHILFPVSRDDVRGSLKSPHTGGLTYMDTRSWVATQRTSAAFFPSLPLELVKALPSQQRVLHRLVYRCYPVLEQDSKHSATAKFIQIEVPLIDVQNLAGVGPSDRSIFTSAVFWSGTSVNVDLLMPDRYMDLRFKVSDMSPLPSSQQPGELTNYLDGLQKFLTCSDPDVTQPVPPLIVTHDAHEYVLATNASVRQSAESLSSVPHKDVTVTSESMLDLESGYSNAVCAVSSDNLGSPQTWNAFLDKCDRLTARSNLKSSAFF